LSPTAHASQPSEDIISDVRVFQDGGYRFLKAVFQYSGAVAAEPGFEIERARFPRPVTLADGFARAKAHLEAIGRPLTAFCACELRSPAPFSEAAFVDFNRAYAGTLERWNIYRDGINPVARTNVCPAFDPPDEPSLYAFSYTVASTAPASRTFIVAGSGEAPEGKANYRDHIVRLGDVSKDGMREKVRFVLAEMERRLASIGFSWRDALETQAYSVHDLGSFFSGEFAQTGAAAHGLTWHFSRPPVRDLEFEMDVRAAARTLVLQGASA
jgi:hypothetical protein